MKTNGRKYKYIFQEKLNTKKFTNKCSEKSMFRTHWAYSNKPESRNGKSMKQFKTVAINEIIIDVDANKDKNPDNINLSGALNVACEIVRILSQFNINVTVYYSGLKGFHVAIPLPKYYEFKTLDIGKTDNIVVFYHNFINYLNSNIKNMPDNIDLDYGLEQTARLVQLRNRKKDNDNGRGYKICIGVNNNLCTDINKIKEASQVNKDLGKALRNNNKNLSKFIDFLYKLQNKGYSEQINTPVNNEFGLKSPISDLQQVLNPLLNELNKIHPSQGHTNIRAPLMYTCKAFTNNFDDCSPIIEILTNDARHGDKTNNLLESLENAFTNGKANKYALWNKLRLLSNDERNELDERKKDDKERLKTDTMRRELLFDFINYFESKITKKQIKTHTEEFKKLLEKYHSCFQLFETELYDYVDNSENIFKGIINALASLYGYGSRFIVVNGGSEVGKSEYINTIKKLMPNFINLGSSTPATIRRRATHAFDKSIVYLGDKGLKGTDDEEFKGLQEVFGGLITEKEFIRDIVIGDKIMKFNLKSDGVCAFYSQPYTNLRVFGAGDQYSTRSTFITVNPVKDGLSVFLQDETKENDFYVMHKDYITYITENPLDLTISNDVKTVIWQASRDSIRTAKYYLALFKSYCQYIQVAHPLTTDALEFLEVFKPKFEVSQIEYMIYKRLYGKLRVLKDTEVENRLYEDGTVKHQYSLTSREKRDTKSFFTAKQIKTYFRTEFKMNKNLKDTIDNIPDILKNLFNADLLGRLETPSGQENIYYIKYNEELEEKGD